MFKMFYIMSVYHSCCRKDHFISINVKQSTIKFNLKKLKRYFFCTLVQGIKKKNYRQRNKITQKKVKGTNKFIVVKIDIVERYSYISTNNISINLSTNIK
jgi:hypothetical protein